jgi:hypothetical protein
LIQQQKRDPGELASADGSSQKQKSYRPTAKRNELTVDPKRTQPHAAAVERMDAHDNYAPVSTSPPLSTLSNWYVRRSRDRFWSA